MGAWPTDSKAGRYFVCYNTAVTLQSTPNARSAEGKASPPSAPAVAGTYRRTGARKPHFFNASFHITKKGQNHENPKIFIWSPIDDYWTDFYAQTPPESLCFDCFMTGNDLRGWVMHHMGGRSSSEEHRPHEKSSKITKNDKKSMKINEFS